MKPQIKAKAHSDDRCMEVMFDATPWFEKASDAEILALAECEWGGDYPADDVARFMATVNEGVKEMFMYLGFRSNKEVVGFECHVDSADAINWIKINHPSLAPKICGAG